MLSCYYVVLLSLPAICVCTIEYCMQETAVYGKGAIKDFVLGQYCFGMHATYCSWNSG